MVASADDVVQIDAGGVARPMGAAAQQRMRAREGDYRVLPAPEHVVLMRRQGGPDDRACVLAGEIQTPGILCDAVSFIGHAGWRGELVVLDGENSRSIYFDQGLITGAQSTVARERLGQVLYRYGILDKAQTDACSSAMDGGEMRFGEAAVRLGYVTREKLFALMAHQIEEIFFGLLLSSTGAFYFLDGYADEALAARQYLSVGTLIREGVRRMHEMRYFRSRIPSEQCVVEKTPGRSEPDNDPLGVYELLDGVRTIGDVCRTLGKSEFDVTRAIFQLVQSAHVTVRPRRVPTREAVLAYNQAIAVILRELDAMDEGDEVRTQLAKFAAKGDVYGKLFAGAGPADDGTLDATKVEANVAAFADRAEAEEMIGRWLHEYASYALFLARPHVRRAQKAATPGDDRPRLSQRVARMLEPIAIPGAGARTPKRGDE
jgi:hypothetical protein